MIIIKMIILYFIQIRHTDDFPSTGTRLVIDYLPMLARVAAFAQESRIPLSISLLPSM